MTPQPELDEYEIKSQPAFNVPGIILLLAVAMVVCQLMTGWISNDAYRAVLLNFAFIPLAYIENAPALPVPYARYWTPVTYAFLHGGWAHLIVNLVWMFAFGSAVARRFGLVRFLLFFALSVHFLKGLVSHTGAKACEYCEAVAETGPIRWPLAKCRRGRSRVVDEMKHAAE